MDEIVSLYNEIRGFRHDYTGMLVSLRMAIDGKDLQEINRVYMKFWSKQIKNYVQISIPFRFETILRIQHFVV